MILFIIMGLLAGALWYRYGERFDQKTMTPRCWEIMHYHNKERFQLYVVHMKSIFAGIALIIAGSCEFKFRNQVIVFIGAAIVGLHIYQWLNEEMAIKNNSTNIINDNIPV
jgi:NADH:ubiquinone oxidoreductase subunit 5 (subunit L)/multisubunit Na+/H+ antiporter MnhA subunit